MLKPGLYLKVGIWSHKDKIFVDISKTMFLDKYGRLREFFKECNL